MFELVGFDFMVDVHLRPFVLEVNPIPSLAKQVGLCIGTLQGGAATIIQPDTYWRYRSPTAAEAAGIQDLMV